MKANHNTSYYNHVGNSVVYQFFKDTNWKQITTTITAQKTFQSCLSVLQRYKLKANHNFNNIRKHFKVVVYQFFKDTNWKQITTCSFSLTAILMLFISSSKIQIESKSQLINVAHCYLPCCLSVLQRYKLKANHNSVLFTLIENTVVYQFFKDTNWKQITTEKRTLTFLEKLFISSSKIQIENEAIANTFKSLKNRWQSKLQHTLPKFFGNA